MLKSLSILIFICFSPVLLIAQETAESLKVGFITDLSGFASYWGKVSLVGAQIAIDEINSSEAQKISLIVGDHSLNTRKVVSEAQRILTANKVDAMYVEFSPTASAASPIIKRSKKLFLCEPPLKSVRDTNPYAFTSFLDYEKGCFQIASHWKSLGINKVGILKAEAEFSELCLTGAKKVFPDIKIEDFKIGEEQESQILRLKKQNIEALLSPGFRGDTINTLKAMSALNLKIPIGNTESEVVSPEIINGYLKKLKGSMVFGFNSIDEEFIAKFKKRYGNIDGVPLEAAAMAYTHLRQIAQALRTCGKNQIDCQIKQMEESPSDKTISFVRFDNHASSYDFILKELGTEGFQSVLTYN